MIHVWIKLFKQSCKFICAYYVYHGVFKLLSCSHKPSFLDTYYDRDDPSLPLLDALREGGFIFPAIDDSNTPQVSKLCLLVH